MKRGPGDQRRDSDDTRTRDAKPREASDKEKAAKPVFLKDVNARQLIDEADGT